jgi:conserved hypothetical protein
MQEEHKTSLGKVLFSAFTIAATVGILAYFMLTEEGLNNLRHVLFHLQPVWLLWIAAGILAGWLLEGYVLHLFCRHLNPEWTFGRSFYVGMLGLFYSSLAPFNMGEPMEIYTMTKMDMDVGKATSIIAVKSLVHHAVTFFYSLFLISFELNYFQTKVSNFAFITVFGLITNSIFIIGVLLFMVNEKLTDTLLHGAVGLLNRFRLKKLAEKLYNKAHGQLMVFHDCSKVIGNAVPLYVTATLLTLVQITVASLISYFVYRSFNLHRESVFIMVAADTFVTMVASFVPLPGSSGGAEGGFYLFFREFFGPSIIPAITLWRISTYYVNIAIGGIIVHFGGKKYKR